MYVVHLHAIIHIHVLYFQHYTSLVFPGLWVLGIMFYNNLSVSTTFNFYNQFVPVIFYLQLLLTEEGGQGGGIFSHPHWQHKINIYIFFYMRIIFSPTFFPLSLTFNHLPLPHLPSPFNNTCMPSIYN